MVYRCAILDDYQNVALKMADWSPIAKDVEVTVFNEHLGGQDKVIKALADFDIICGMRERTAFSRAVIGALPKLKLLITTGARNASFDLKASSDRNVIVCGTPSVGNPTAGIAIGLMLELTRRVGYENARMKAGEAWQTTIGLDLGGLTLGVIGLGKLGQRVARIAKAFGMDVIAWSQNLTAERCREAGVEYANKEDLLQRADILTIHVVLSQRTRGLIGAKELGLMKPGAYLINTSRGPIVDEPALIKTLRSHAIAGAAMDVFDQEPLPPQHPLRNMNNVLATPHIGYVTVSLYRTFYGDVVKSITTWLDEQAGATNQ